MWDYWRSPNQLVPPSRSSFLPLNALMVLLTEWDPADKGCWKGARDTWGGGTVVSFATKRETEFI